MSTHLSASEQFSWVQLPSEMDAGRFLRRARRAAGDDVTATAVAKYLGNTPTTVGRWENQGMNTDQVRYLIALARSSAGARRAIASELGIQIGGSPAAIKYADLGRRGLATIHDPVVATALNLLERTVEAAEGKAGGGAATSTELGKPIN